MRRIFYGFAGSMAVVVAISMLRCVSSGINPNDLDECDEINNGYFSIYSPRWEDSLKMGAQDSIMWSNRSFTIDSVSLSLYDDNKFVQPIKTKVKNSGISSWKIPRVQAGDKYRIKITSAADTARFDYSCPFSIFSNYSGSFTIQSPAAAAACTAGTTTLQIRWQSSGTPGDSVFLELCIDTVPLSLIAGAIGNKGSFPWSIPRTILTKDNYRVKIASCFDSGISALSAPFTIKNTFYDSLPECSPDSFEPDNRRDFASTLGTLGKAQSHTLTIDDTDWVKVSLDSGSIYILQSYGGLSTMVYLFYGGEASYTTYFGGSPASLRWTCTKKGVWYIRITSYSNGNLCGTYTFNVTAFDPLNSVTFTSPTQGAIWAAGSSQQIKWTPDATVLGTNVNIYLYKGSRQLLLLSSNLSNSGLYNWGLPNGVATDGDYRIRIVNYSDTSVGGYSASFTITGIKPDAYEPDNRRDSASTLSPLGNAQPHNLTINDTDWVKFSLDSGTIYILQSRGSLPTSVYLFYDSEASYTTYFSGSSASGSLRWTCPKKGAWYARIISYSGGGSTGTYTFNVAAFDPFTSVTITSPGQGTTWSAGSTYQIKWTPDSALLGTYVSVRLYKGSWQLISITGSANNSGIYDWSIPSGLETGNDYRIILASTSDPAILGISSYFVINGISPDAYEPDNKRDSASTLSPLGKAQSHTLTMNDTDWVKFSADSGRKYVLQSYGNIATRVYLFYGANANYSTYFSSYANSSALQWTCPTSGVWYARITSTAGGSVGGAYSFNVSAFDSLTAVAITSPTATSVWNAGSSCTIKWIPDSSVLGTSVIIYLYKGNRSCNLAISAANSGSINWSLPAGIATGSDYRIKISNASNSSFGGFSASFSINGITPDSYEPDDSASKASTIATDGTVQNRSLPAGDVDWISFAAQKDSIYLISATSESGAIMFLYIYNSSFDSVLNWQEAPNPKLVLKCPQNGTYALAIAPSSGYGNYTVSIKKYPRGVAVNFIDPIAQAIWSAGSSYTIQWAPDTVLFGQYVSLQLNNDTTMVQIITDATQNTGTYSWTIPAGLTTGSNYAIKLSSYGNPILYGYSPVFSISGITKDAYEPDDSVAQAHQIATTGTPENHSLTLNDVDWCAFSAEVNNLYAVKIKVASRIRAVLDLYGTDGSTSIASTTTKTSDSSATILMYCLTPGKFYFRTTSSTGGAYQATVTGYDSTQYGFVLTSPKAGDSIAIGGADTITWSSQVSVGGNVDIYLYNASGLLQTIVANTSNDGSYRWTVPAAVNPGSDYYVKIQSRFNSHILGSSGVFTIKAN